MTGRAAEVVAIAPRFRGRPEWAHGGYACGLVASRVGTSAEVTLYRQLPLDAPLRIERDDEGGVRLRAADEVLAVGVPRALEVPAPPPTGWAEAVVAARGYRWRAEHPMPECFVCGIFRPPGDGLRIFAGPLAGRAAVAAPWIPDASLGDGRGTVRTEVLWATLECPARAAVSAALPSLRRCPRLHRIAATLRKPPEVGSPCVVVGWVLGKAGAEPRLRAGTAVLSEAGEPLATGELWFALE